MFKRELERLINKHSKENDSNTPDFILAEYLNNCLETFNKTVNKRTIWYEPSLSNKGIINDQPRED